MRIAIDAPFLIGHRGAPSLEPENTLASFRAALDAGLDGIEIDVHRSSDGVLVVHHDPATAAGQDIARTPWAELIARNPSLPRLEQVFEVMEAYRDRFLNIELKSRFPWDDGRATDLARALAGWSNPARERTWISSFDPLALIELQRRGPEVPRALLVFGSAALAIPELVPSLRIAGLHVQQTLANVDAIARWHERGWFVFAWTVNDAARARELVRAGVDGIIGDHPARLQSALSARDG